MCKERDEEESERAVEDESMPVEDEVEREGRKEGGERRGGDG